ncbi:hypothetical protein LOTGIDRAFT_232212 [Lottia gigantea]|uniref:Uncharacterized protein n=1 Tax=Lottia gigantea TaxID=225164 RepID=V4C0Z0_LOTGI|nr:hypothetical protein LOTGIDRAFT_232212 [Lottia gigantea]ESO95124.1 hypothetical protein LOTGIDRAFT_232212 [Lottia gigantea]
MKLSVILVLFLVVCCEGFLFNWFGAKWNGLKVTWGLNIFSKNVFSSLPRTVADAKSDGYQLLSQTCSGLFEGYRYIKNGDNAVILIFDTQGFIAGLQVGVKNGQANGYPFPSQKPPFVTEGDYNYLTAYFVEPSTICKSGRSQSEFDTQGTGTGLYFQNSTNPLKDLVKIPMKPDDLQNTKWVKGKCFPSMGLHYWYDLSEDLSCQSMFPVFLLYNGGDLNGFGWAMTTDLDSKRYEHPTPDKFSAFMTEVPTCLNTIGTISTMHVYLTSKPLLNFC